MIEELLMYQQADAKLYAIESKLSGSEDRKKAAVAKKYVDGAEEKMANLEARAAKLIEEYNRAVQEQKEIADFGKEFESAIAEADDSNALSYLEKRAEGVENKIKVLTDKLGEIEKQMQLVLKEYADFRDKLKNMQEQFKESAKNYNELRESVKADKEEIEKELEELKARVDPALMERYMAKRKAKVYPVLYAINGENMCGACNMELSMADTNKLKKGEVIECSQCGRLLYKK